MEGSRQVLAKARAIIKDYHQLNGMPAETMVPVVQELKHDGYLIEYGIRNGRGCICTVETEHMLLTDIDNQGYTLFVDGGNEQKISADKKSLLIINAKIDSDKQCIFDGNGFTINTQEGMIYIDDTPIGVRYAESINIRYYINPGQILLIEPTVAGVEFSLTVPPWLV